MTRIRSTVCPLVGRIYDVLSTFERERIELFSEKSSAITHWPGSGRLLLTIFLWISHVQGKFRLEQGL